MQYQVDSREEAGAIFEHSAAMSGIYDAVVTFTQVENFTTFLAEYACVDGDIVLHFFPPREMYVQTPGTSTHRVLSDFMLRWQREFPRVLSPTAEAYFKATYPQLAADYVPEMTSWWMRASGFARTLDPDSFIRGFLESLDQALDASAFLR